MEQEPTLTIEWVFDAWVKAVRTLRKTKNELKTPGDECAQADIDIAAAKELRYEEVEDPNGGDSHLRPLETLQKELVATVASSYDAEGKTKDDRERDLMRYVREAYSLYDAWTDRIERSFQEERRQMAVLNGKSRQFTALQKKLWAEQEVLSGLNKLIAFCTTQENAESTMTYQQDLLAVEQRFTQKVEDLSAQLSAKNETQAKLRDMLLTTLS